MANLQPGEGSGASDVPGESSDATLQLNIKTLDSRIFSFHVDKNILVTAFKEKIASQIGVPVGQQRLIFRGKVLKDDHPLSEYYVENGDTLHLVERQPQPPPGLNTGEATSSNNNGGQDSTAGGPRNRIGQIAHSVVLGTLNVGDPGEAVPDLSRVLGAVLSSIGIGNLPGGGQPGVQTPNGNETERSQGNAGSQSQGGNQFNPFQSAAHPMLNPSGAAIVVPSLNMPIPDSLNTLTEFMNGMELVLSQNGTQHDQSPSASGSLPTPELPRNSHGYPTVAALTNVLRHAQRLLSDHVVPALSQTAGRLDQQVGSGDPAVRGQVETESVQLGVAMQHMGALLLELGRTILTLRIGQNPGESFVNAGPAAYISPSGPNPIMVQPFPFQASSLFGGSSGVAQNHFPMGPLGVGSISRNVNIHIHTGAALAPIVPMMGNRAPNGEEIRGQRVNGASGESGQPQVPLGVNVTTNAVPSRPAIVSVSGAVQPGAGVSLATDPSSISSIVADINAQLRRAVNRQSENQAPSGGSADQQQAVGYGVRETEINHQRNLSSSTVGETTQTLPDANSMDNQKDKTDTSTSSDGGPHNRSSMPEHGGSLEGPSGSSEGINIKDGSSDVPLGLGLGGLQPKKRGRQPKSQAVKSDGASSSSSHNLNSRAVGQHVLQSLASLSTKGNANPPSSEQPQNADDHVDAADAISQVLGSPSLDGLLAGVSQQAGLGSPDMLRNMFQQVTQNPAMRNTVNQIAQQMDSQDIGSMFSGSDGGGGFDLSRMMQQMMPIVSQALGGISSASRQNPPSGQVVSSSRIGTAPTNDDPQIDLRQVVERLENQSPPVEIFGSLVDRVVQVSIGGAAEESVVMELCSQSVFAEDFMEMLLLDLSERLQDGM